jgi:formylglycine-generating enzyme required for sulfatase activity
MSDINDFIDFTQRASIGLTRRIPSGSVRMGSRFHPREDPPHTEFVREFEIGHVPVTDEGWAWRQGDLPGWGREDRSQPDAWKIQARRFHHPVTGITRYEAEAYCRWIGKIKKKSVRLPTEEEWERTARGGDTRPYPWGEEFDPAYANTLESEKGSTVGTGSITQDASPFGVHDLAGNIQEWTASVYEALADETIPPVPHAVVRGGSYNDTAYGARTSYRRGYPHGYFYPYLGFRLVVGIK